MFNSHLCLYRYYKKIKGQISNKHRQNKPWEQMRQVRGQASPLFCKSIPEVAAQAQTGSFWNGNVAVGCTLTRQVGVNVVELKGRAISVSQPLCIRAYLGRAHGLAAYADFLMDVSFCIVGNLAGSKRGKNKPCCRKSTSTDTYNVYRKYIPVWITVVEWSWTQQDVVWESKASRQHVVEQSVI